MQSPQSDPEVRHFRITDKGAWEPDRQPAGRNFALGLDLGQAQDFTAVVVAERSGPAADPSFAIRRAERLPLGTSYPKVIEHVRELLEKPQLAGAALVVDAMGVGMPVVDQFLAEGLPAIAVKVHGGSEETKSEKGVHHVPKRNLVAVLQVSLQNKRLAIAGGIPQADHLVRELLAYRVKISAAGHDSYEAWREGDHDDLVFAAGLAVWWLQRHAGESVTECHGTIGAGGIGSLRW